MKTNILKTYIHGLDVILKGGFIRSHTYLLTGTAGTGKTILSFQIIKNNLEKGEKCMYITLQEPYKTLIDNIKPFGWKLDDIKIVDLTPGSKNLNLEQYQIFSPHEVEISEIWEQIFEKIEEYRPTLLVIDSITFLQYQSFDEYQFRKHIIEFVNYLNSIECTSFLLYEPSELVRDISLALSVDGVISLSRVLSESRVIDIRAVEIQKMRGSDYLSGLHSLRITSQGIVIYPHIIESGKYSKISEEKLFTGIKELDELLKGGIEEGTSTLITGPTGVGKSTLGILFLYQALEKGKHAVLYSFEESKEYIVKRATNIKINILPYLEAQKLKIMHINPLELYPDEFLEFVRRDVFEGANIIMIDSLKGYYLSMEQFGSMLANVQNMINFLRTNGVSTILINEVAQITGDLSLTEFGISYIIDNALLLRYAELNGQLIRVIGCVKKRLGDFEPDIREIKINNNEGIKVGKKLENVYGILTGVPTIK